jgi:DNA-binding NarL/FixJ family response regulator
MDTHARAALVEDMRALRVVVQEIWRGAQAQLEHHELSGELQIVASARALEQWLAQQEPDSVRLLILDYQVEGGTVLELLQRLRGPGRRHPALHPEALVVGWSIHGDAAEHFRLSGAADGFISKHRPARTLVESLLTILARRRAGADWVEL